MDKATKITVIAVSVVLLAVALFFAIRAIKKYLENKSFNDQDTVDNPKTKAEREKNRKAYANIFANQLRTAFNPTGNGWMIDIDGTSTDAVMKVAAGIKEKEVPFSYVAAAYNTAYKSSLAAQLQSELSSTELSKFYATAGMQGVGTVARWDARIGVGSLGAVTDASILA